METNPLKVLLILIVSGLTILMFAGRIALGFMMGGLLGGVFMTGMLGFVGYKIFTEK